MDEPALRLGNRLVGNPDNAAAIEMTLAGLEVRFEDDGVVALAGARFEATLEGRPVNRGESLRVRAGQKLAVGRTLEGARAVLAVHGGIDVPSLLGSRSTCLGGGFGGLDGRPLRAGDRLAAGRRASEIVRRRLRSEALPAYSRESTLRVVAGPQSDRFSDHGRQVFFNATYTISPSSDRTGLRLDGPPIERSASADSLPEGMVPGVVQIPADGRPIILGADCPVTGGYAKIAAVISADLWRVAQAKPGDRVRFVEVAAEEARGLYRRQQELLRTAVEELDG
jgi:biotin-dependent carboxylase-like uncharacterized protein